MTPSHLDPRIRRTRSYLRKALIELVLEKGSQDLSVKDLTERACINRSTFYRHYRDLDDLLTTGFGEYWDQVLPGTQLFIYHKPSISQDRLLGILAADLEHFDQLRDFYRITLVRQEIPLLRESLFNHFLKTMRARFTPLLSLTSLPAVPLDMIHRWMASAYFGLILDWLAEDQPAPSAGLAAQISRLMTLQLRGITGQDDLPLAKTFRQEQAA